MIHDYHHAPSDANFEGSALLNEQAKMLSESTPSDINFLQFLKLRLSAQQRATAQRNYWQRVQEEVESGPTTAVARSASRSVTASTTASNGIPVVDNEASPAASSWNVQTTPVWTPASNNARRQQYQNSSVPHNINSSNTNISTHHNVQNEGRHSAMHGVRSPLDDSSVFNGSVASRHDATSAIPQQPLQLPLFASHQMSNEHLQASVIKRANTNESSALESPLTNSHLESRTTAIDEKPAIASGTPQIPAGADDMKGVVLQPCPHCGRTFAPDRLERHATTCERQQMTNLKQRTDVKERKLSSANAGNYARAAGAKAMPPDTASTSTLSVAPGDGATTSASGPAKMEKWRRQSAQLRSALAGMSAVEDDRVPCPHCGRRFSEDAAGRHIPICEAKEERRA